MRSLESENHTKAQEKKADKLVPQHSGRFHNRRNHVLDEYFALAHGLPALADSQALPGNSHDTIVTKPSISSVSPTVRRPNCRCYLRFLLVNPVRVHYNRNGWRPQVGTPVTTGASTE